MPITGPRPRSGILEISPYVGGKAKVAEGAPAVKLSANESPIGPSPKAIAAYRAEAERLHRYPDGGCTALRAAIGRRFNLDPTRILCGAGSDELIALLVRAYAGPGEEVLHSAHGFLMYRLAALAAGAHPVAAPEEAHAAHERPVRHTTRDEEDLRARGEVALGVDTLQVGDAHLAGRGDPPGCARPRPLGQPTAAGRWRDQAPSNDPPGSGRCPPSRCTRKGGRS